MNETDARRPPDLVRPEGHRRLMVVDDTEASRTVIADHFRALGYDVSVAADGVEALAQSFVRRADVVIMNLTLPGLEGYEVAAILRKISPGVRIILTVEADLDERSHENEWTERFRCFRKPLDFEAISRAMEEAEP